VSAQRGHILCTDKASVDDTNQQICRAFSPPLRAAQPDKKPGLLTFMPYARLISNHISRMLSHHIESAVGLCLRKISSFLWSVKAYIGHMGCSIDASLKELQ
jgi:hypothetical protein